MLLVSAQHMAHITRSQRLRCRQVAYIDDMAICFVTLRSKNLTVAKCQQQSEATKMFDLFRSPCILHGRAMNGLKSRVVSSNVAISNAIVLLNCMALSEMQTNADKSTPASLLHRINGAAVLAAKVCSNSTVPT